MGETLPRDEDETSVPCAEALVAGTVALMTTWAIPCPGCSLPQAQQRDLLARKVASNLFFLKQHPALGPAMRLVMARAHQWWASVVPSATVAEPTDPAPMLERSEGTLH